MSVSYRDETTFSYREDSNPASVLPNASGKETFAGTGTGHFLQAQSRSPAQSSTLKSLIVIEAFASLRFTPLHCGTRIVLVTGRPPCFGCSQPAFEPDSERATCPGAEIQSDAVERACVSIQPALHLHETRDRRRYYEGGSGAGGWPSSCPSDMMPLVSHENRSDGRNSRHQPRRRRGST